ncbi:MAG: hypothetical protein EOP06_31215 [Proteobacteria bacterium]|nr:MAG: hypothetical protein EOP06_31215 [Pseudomonadota bacterium]
MPQPEYSTLTNESKLYVQLQPGQETIQWLQRLQSQLDPEASAVSTNQLHMTVIHFGKIQKLIDSISSRLKISEADLLECTNHLVQAWSARLESIEDTPIIMKSTTHSLFGANHTTYVVEFDAAELAIQLHSECLFDLEAYFRTIGITDPTMFMQQDFNFQHALELRPHVTIAKHYSGSVPPALLNTPIIASFRTMKIVY